MPLSQVQDFIQRKILPTAFGEALSYYEELILLVDKLNEVVDYVNSLASITNSYTDEQIAILTETLNTRIDSVYSYAQTLNVNLTGLIGSTKTELIASYTSLISSNVSTINNRITNEVATLNGRITYEMEILKDYIDNQIIDLKVMSPVTGGIVSVQTALNHLADLMKVDALSASAYDALELTATSYDAKELQAIDYDFRGGALLP